MRAEGLSFPEIARELKYHSRQAAHAAVTRALREMFREPLEEMIQLDLERIDRIWNIHYLNAQAGDVQALAACMRLMERRARLLGLDAPVRTETKVTSPDGSMCPKITLEFVDAGQPPKKA